MGSSVLQVLDDFSKQVDRIQWPVGSPASIHYAALDGHLSRYQVGWTEASKSSLAGHGCGRFPGSLGVGVPVEHAGTLMGTWNRSSIQAFPSLPCVCAAYGL